MEAGADLEQAPMRPRSVMRPSVGCVMRDRILSSVLLPAPLRPISPTTSPGWISKRDVAQRPELAGREHRLQID